MTQAEIDKAVRLAFGVGPGGNDKVVVAEVLPGKTLSIKDIVDSYKSLQIPKWALDTSIMDEWRKKIEKAVARPECWKWIDPKPGSMIMAVPENETRQQYDARMKEKAEKRLAKEVADLAHQKKEAAKDKHWTDRLYKSWPGAVGSLWELKI